MNTTRERSATALQSILAQSFPDIGNTPDRVSLVVLIVASVFFAHDLYADLFLEGKSWSHVVIEGSVFVAVLLALTFEVRRVLGLRTHLRAREDQVNRFKARLIEIIRRQFDQWQLTDTQKDIALLLIKGLSMQEIADLRHVKEKSVRQQAIKIYTKANVANRNELTSYFIQELLTINETDYRPTAGPSAADS